jgi:hypothetical protein
MRLLISMAVVACFVAASWAQVDDDVEHPWVDPREVLWDYDQKPRKVRRALAKLLEEEGMALAPESSKEVLITEFMEFTSQHYGVENVAEPAPKLTEEYGFLQPRKVTQGRLRLEVQVQPTEQGSQVRLRSQILVKAFHSLARGGSAEAERRSNGSIEAYLQAKLGAALGQAGPSSHPD